MKRIIRATFVLLLLTLYGCGGGESSTGTQEPKRVVIFFVSGHDNPLFYLPDGIPSKSYLQDDIGAEIVKSLESADYLVEPNYYADHYDVVDGHGGFIQLLSDIKAVRKDNNTKIVIIAHSHGGVWAHAAAIQANQVEIDLLVDLDTSSALWKSLLHDTSLIGGDPVSKYFGTYDTEDVVPSNVKYALEVRSGARLAFFLEEYDEQWNTRLDGTKINLEQYFSSSTHDEVHQAGGATSRYVIQWLNNKLGSL